MKVHKGGIFAINYNITTGRLVTGGKDKTINVYDNESPKKGEWKPFELENYARGLDQSDDN